MHGSGILIINAPWRFEEQLRRLVPRLAEVLATDEAGHPAPPWRIDVLDEA
jgi:23S rRNA (adenine2030-N6)-methyltransferase